jgi:hypothetical protein
MTVTGRIGRLIETEALVGLVAELGLLTDTLTLREAGLDGRRIADLSGQKTPSMARPKLASRAMPTGTASRLLR